MDIVNLVTKLLSLLKLGRVHKCHQSLQRVVTLDKAPAVREHLALIIFGTEYASGTYTLPPDVEIYGGFDGTEVDLSERDPNPITNGAILCGEILTGDLIGNSIHVVTAGGVGMQSLLDGLTITSGYDRQGGSAGWGSGIYNVAGAATFSNL